MQWIRQTVSGLVACGLLVAAAPADTEHQTATMPIPGMTPTGSGGDSEEKKDFPDFDKVVTDDFKVIALAYNPDGSQDAKSFYTLYHNTKTDELLAQIPSDKLNQDFMISSSISKGPFVAGWMWGDQIVRWERRDKKLLLVEPDLLNTGKEGTALSDAVARTYTDRIIQTIPIKTLKGADPVIDVGDLFKNDYAKIGQFYGGALDPSLARWTKVKCFKDNLVLTVESPFVGQGSGSWFFDTGTTAGTLVATNYNMSAIPETGYKPRMADDRIGYFTTVQRDWGKDYKAKTLFNRYVNRWHLEKEDPSLETSPVKNPIVFYIEKTVPVRFRNAVKEGILEWNKAFEKCGYIDALQVRQQTETHYADIDPEDVNYNFFRWTTTGIGIAVGPSRANPRTGQIYDADIVFDDGWIRGPMETYSIFGNKRWSEWTRDGKLRAFLEAHPMYDICPRHENLAPGYVDRQEQNLTEFKPDFEVLRSRFGRHMCDYGSDLRNELTLAGAIFAAQGLDEIPDAFLQQVVKEVVMHEVGHTLGLRHNFKASSWLPLDEVLKQQETEKPIGASVMDYNAFMFHEDQEKQGDFLMRTIGPYDEWAIEYGYRPVGEPHKSEEEMLKAITSRVAESGLDYATDEDASILDPDPLVNRRDMGSDPLAYAKYRIQLSKKLMQNMSDWAVDDGESYSRLRQRFNRVLNEIANASIYAGRFVGGQYVHRDHKGDPNAREPFVMVSAEKQREAMKVLADEVLSEDAFSVDAELLTKLAPGRWRHWGSTDFDYWLEYNIHEQIQRIQTIALMPVLNPFTITRLHDMQLMYKADEEPYTLAEHMRTLGSEIWSELEKPMTRTYTDRDPLINSIRRGLQRIHSELMVGLILTPPNSHIPGDVNSLLRMNADLLKDKIHGVLESDKIDDASRAHLVDIEQRLTKALNAEFQQG